MANTALGADAFGLEGSLGGGLRAQCQGRPAGGVGPGRQQGVEARRGVRGFTPGVPSPGSYFTEARLGQRAGVL